MHNGKVIQLGQSEVHCPCHACAFFHSTDEEYELLLPFTRDGYGAGEHIFHVVDKQHREERRRRLKDSGIDVESAERSGQMEVRSWEEAYLRGNRFDQEAMLELIQSVLRSGRDKGYPMTRLWANM